MVVSQLGANVSQHGGDMFVVVVVTKGRHREAPFLALDRDWSGQTPQRDARNPVGA